jgi:hypothetical protein
MHGGSPWCGLLRRALRKAREERSVSSGKTGVQRSLDKEVKEGEKIRAHMCVPSGARVTDEKILISAKRFRRGRHLAYVIRNAGHAQGAKSVERTAVAPSGGASS